MKAFSFAIVAAALVAAPALAEPEIGKPMAPATMFWLRSMS